MRWQSLALFMIFVMTQQTPGFEPPREIVDAKGSCGRLTDLKTLMQVFGGKKFCLIDGGLVLKDPTLDYAGEQLPICRYGPSPDSRWFAGNSGYVVCKLLGLDFVAQRASRTSARVIKLSLSGSISGTEYDYSLKELHCR